MRQQHVHLPKPGDHLFRLMLLLSRSTSPIGSKACFTEDHFTRGRPLGRVGDKWTVLVVVALRERPHRFSELKRQVGDISQQMLTSTLKALERDGMVTRSVRATTPPQVSYELTDLGRSLSQTVRQIADWSIANLAAIHANRRRYDERPSAT